MVKMMKNETDKRIIKTKKSIKEAFVSLLQEKPVSKITVSELAAAASINRATFYLHYTDVPSVLTDIERDVSEAYLNCLKSFDKTLSVYQNVLNFMKAVHEEMEATSAIYKAVLESVNSELLVAKLKALLVDNLQEGIRLLPSVIDKEEFRFAATFLASGLIEMYMTWYHQKRDTISTNQMMAYCADLATRVLSKYEQLLHNRYNLV